MKLNTQINYIILFIIVCSAIVVRLPMIESVDFLPMKQTIAFIETKNIFLNHKELPPEIELYVSNAQMQQVSKRELPILESIYGYIYYLIDKEVIFVPKLLSIFTWILSGIYLFRILKHFFTFTPSALSLIIYLNIPFGVLISRSYLTEPYLMAFFAMSIFYIIKFKDNESFKNLLIAAVPSFILCLLKIDYIILISFFYMFYCFLFNGFRKSLFNYYNYLFAILIFSSSIFYLNNIVNDENLNSFIRTQFNFYLFLNPSFWLGWIAQISIVATLPLFVIMIIVIYIIKKDNQKFRALTYALVIAYLIKALLQTYYTSTHDYYNVSLILITCLVSGYFFNNFINLNYLYSRIPKLFFFSFLVIAFSLNSGIEIFKTNYDRKARMEKNEINSAYKIGEILKNNTKILFLSYSEGYPLMYYGNMSGKGINLRNEILENHLGEKKIPNLDTYINQNELHFVPEYFVVTDIYEFKRKKSLKDYLEKNYKIYYKELDYIIYDLKN